MIRPGPEWLIVVLGIFILIIVGIIFLIKYFIRYSAKQRLANNPTRIEEASPQTNPTRIEEASPQTNTAVYCGKCGSALGADDAFCKGCGEKR